MSNEELFDLDCICEQFRSGISLNTLDILHHESDKSIINLQQKAIEAGCFEATDIRVQNTLDFVYGVQKLGEEGCTQASFVLPIKEGEEVLYLYARKEGLTVPWRKMFQDIADYEVATFSYDTKGKPDIKNQNLTLVFDISSSFINNRDFLEGFESFIKDRKDLGIVPKIHLLFNTGNHYTDLQKHPAMVTLNTRIYPYNAEVIPSGNPEELVNNIFAN